MKNKTKQTCSIIKILKVLFPPQKVNNRPIGTISKTLDCGLNGPGSIHFSLRLIMKSFLRSFALYLCSDMYRSYQPFAKVKVPSTHLVNCLPRNDAVAELCFLGASKWLTAVSSINTTSTTIIQQNFLHNYVAS
jgi:hypothetical protein